MIYTLGRLPCLIFYFQLHLRNCQLRKMIHCPAARLRHCPFRYRRSQCTSFVFIFSTFYDCLRIQFSFLFFFLFFFRNMHHKIATSNGRLCCRHDFVNYQILRKTIWDQNGAFRQRNKLNRNIKRTSNAFNDGVKVKTHKFNNTKIWQKSLGEKKRRATSVYMYDISFRTRPLK